MKKHPILFNAILIIITAVLGIVIVSLSLSLFTKHGQYKNVPSVVNMSYTDAINKLDKAGFKVEISDSVYRTDLKPGYVLEQTPGANTNVKPGRVVYLVINAVSPKQVAIANMQGVSLRQAKSVLEGMGFKDIRVSYKMGKDKDIVLGIKVQGRVVRNGQKVSINTPVVIEVSNGRIDQLTDSLRNLEYGSSVVVGDYGADEYSGSYGGGYYHSGGGSSTSAGTSSSTATETQTEEEDIDPYAGHESTNSTSEEE